jgi:site-specific DNA-methyltransferase (adenine-specific)
MKGLNWRIGDCLELLPSIEDKSIDLILTDLPYGKTQNRWDAIIPFESLWAQYNRIIKDNGAILLTGLNPFSSGLILSNVDMYKYDWVWDKNNVSGHLNSKHRPMTGFELIHCFYRTQPTYNPVMWESKPMNSVYRNANSQSKNYGEYKSVPTKPDQLNRTTRYPKNIININALRNNSNERVGHPTQKPIALAEYLIKTYTNEGDTVHDSCMGSGWSLHACRNLNRNFIGFEISDEWEFNYRPHKKV